MSDHHHHHSSPALQKLNTAFLIGIVLNFIFVIIEVLAGYDTNSLSLFTDAGHNLSDVGSLLLSLLAFKLAKIKSTTNYTYGYQKTTILASLINSILLFVAVGVILWEAYHRMGKPTEIKGLTVALVAAIGIIINAVSAFLFFKDKEKDINVKGAYLHLISDALVSLGVVIGGIVIYFTKIYWIDILLSVIIAAVIIYSSWSLLKDSIRLSLDGVPAHIDLKNIKSRVLKIDGVLDIHHMHVWAISSTQIAMTAHLVVSSEAHNAKVLAIKKSIKHELEHLSIHHVTLETEYEHHLCKDADCSFI